MFQQFEFELYKVLKEIAILSKLMFWSLKKENGLKIIKSKILQLD